jgi:hypothetical protein
MKQLATCIAAIVLIPCATSSAEKVTAQEAKTHVGETATVCCRVASANHAMRSKE